MSQVWADLRINSIKPYWIIICSLLFLIESIFIKVHKIIFKKYNYVWQRDSGSLFLWKLTACSCLHKVCEIANIRQYIVKAQYSKAESNAAALWLGRAFKWIKLSNQRSKFWRAWSAEQSTEGFSSLITEPSADRGPADNVACQNYTSLTSLICIL